MPGRVTYLWFYPKEPGKHVVSCGEYCGIMHSYMAGYVIVKTKEDFDKWYNEEEAKLNQKASIRDASVAKKEA
jgi:cytochrome c oxidase subunit 2